MPGNELPEWVRLSVAPEEEGQNGNPPVTTGTPPATAGTPSPAPQQNVPVDYSAKAAGYRQAAATLQAELNAAKTANESAQNAHVDAYNSVPYRPLGFYTKLQSELSPYQAPTAAELQRQVRRERSNKLVAALGDGISAIANLAGTAAGGLNAYDGKNTMSQRYADMYEKLRQERKGDQEKHIQSLLQGVAADDANAENMRRNTVSRGAAAAKYANDRYAQALEQLRYNEGMANDADRAAMQQYNADRTFNEGQRQFNEGKALQRQQLGISAGHLALARQQYNDANNMRFVVKGNAVDIPVKYMTRNNIEKMYSLVRGNLYGKRGSSAGAKNLYNQFLRDEQNSTTGLEPMSDEAKLGIIQKYLDHAPGAQTYLQTLKTGKSPSNPSKGSGGGGNSGSQSSSHKNDPYGGGGTSNHKNNPFG